MSEFISFFGIHAYDKQIAAHASSAIKARMLSHFALHAASVPKSIKEAQAYVDFKKALETETDAKAT